jgi:hypothetical protein
MLKSMDSFKPPFTEFTSMPLEMTDETAALTAGGHFNPPNVSHGIPPFTPRHVGDLGNLYYYDVNTAKYYYPAHELLKIDGGVNSVIGRAVVVHANQDDCQNPTGNSGSRLALCVVGIRNTATVRPSTSGVPTTQDTSACVPATTGTTGTPATTGIQTTTGTPGTTGSPGTMTTTDDVGCTTNSCDTVDNCQIGVCNDISGVCEYTEEDDGFECEFRDFVDDNCFNGVCRSGVCTPRDTIPTPCDEIDNTDVSTASEMKAITFTFLVGLFSVAKF